MRALAVELADRVPEVDVSQLQYFRANSDMGEAVSLLLWLDADPDRALTYTQTSHQHQALEVVEDPNQAAEVWQRRGCALHALALEPGPTPIADELTERIRASGWDHTLRWVDALAERYRRRHLKAVEGAKSQDRGRA